MIAFLRGKSLSDSSVGTENSLKKNNFLKNDVNLTSSGSPKSSFFVVSPTSISRRISESSNANATAINLSGTNAKKITRISGATESSSHSLDQEELDQFALHLNEICKHDKDLKQREEINSDNFFDSCQDGLVLSKLINNSAPETIDERVLNIEKKNSSGSVKLNPFQMTENINLAINSAKAIGCSVVNIGPVDILEGRKHLILGLVWQIIKVGLLAKINLQFHPELTRLLEKGETLEEFLKLPADSILLRWFNFQLKRAGVVRKVSNFGEDLVDSECYLHLLQILSPENCSKQNVLTTLASSNLEVRAEKVVSNAQSIGCDKYISIGSILKANHKLNLAFVANLFNHYPGLEQLTKNEMAELDDKLFTSEGDRESRTFALWMNSLGVDPFVNSIGDDLKDGRILLQVIDQIKSGTVNWKRVYMKPSNSNSYSNNPSNQLTRFQALENTNNVVELCRSFNFSLVGIQGADLTDGVMKLTLALVWQLMRQHIIETLKGLSFHNDGQDIKDEDLITWANEMVLKRRKTLAQTQAKSSIGPIKSFKDPSLKSGRFLLELLAEVNASMVNFELITPGSTEEEAKSNAKYAISVARKLGASIFLLPDDILNVQPKMLFTFIGTIMAIHLRDQNQRADYAEETHESEIISEINKECDINQYYDDEIETSFSKKFNQNVEFIKNSYSNSSDSE